MSKKRLIILGGGSTGLSTAYLMRNNHEWETVLIERSDKVGGLAGSFKWKGHIIDYGPHRLSPNIRQVVNLVKDLLGQKLLEGKSDHGVQINNRVYRFPILIQQWLNPQSLAWGAKAVLSLVFNLIRSGRPRNSSFPEILKRRFGPFLYRETLSDMTAKVWIAPEKIDPSFADERFSPIKPMEIVKSLLVKTSSRNPDIFYYPAMGYQQIWDEMQASCANTSLPIHIQTEYIECQLENNVIKKISWIDRKSGKLIEADANDTRILSTIPISVFCRGMRSDDAELNQLIAQSKKIKIRSMILFSVEFDQPQTLPHRTMIYPSERIIFNRLFEQNRYSRETVEAGKSVVVADITCDPADRIYRQSDTEIADLVLADFKQLRSINLDHLSDWTVTRVPFAYMVPDINSRTLLKCIVQRLQCIENLDLLGRFSIGEYDNSDYAIQNALNYSRHLENGAYLDQRFKLTEKREIIG